MTMYLPGKGFSRVDVSFCSAALAALCNSERRLAERWGGEDGRTIARRLLDLAAVDADHVGRLPWVEISTNGTGETTIRFGERIVVEGVITRASPGGRVADPDRILVTGVAVEGSDGR